MSRRVLLFVSTSLAAACALQAAAAEAPAPSVAEVVVTASPLGGPEHLATLVDQVRRDQVLQRGGGSLADALVSVPGVASSGFAAGAGRPVIRGMDANRVRVLEDGLSSSDVSDVGPDHGVPIDPLAMQSIEVVRGAGSLRYGSQAIGGVVNAINNRVPRQRVDKPVSVDASAGFSSVSNGKDGSILLDAGAGPFALHADTFTRETDDYRIPGGKQENSFTQSSGYSVGGSVFAPNGSRTGVALVHLNSQYGIPSDTTFIDMRQDKVLSSSSLKLDGPVSRVNLDVSYGDYLHSEKEPDGTPLANFKNQEVDGRLETLFGPLGLLHSSAVGVEIQDRRFSALGEAIEYLFPTHTATHSAFGFTEVELSGRFHLQGAVRVEHVQIDGVPASEVATRRSFTPVSGSAGLVYDASDKLKLGLTLTSAARAPAQTELFARGAHDGPQTFETGNPDLKVERANSVEGTLRSSLWSVNLEGSAWASVYQDYIFGQLTGRVCDDEGDCAADGEGELRELNYAQRDARFWGLEGKADVPLHRSRAGRLELNLQGDYVRAQFTGGGGNVPRIPPYRVGGGLSWSSDRIDAGFLLLGVGAQNDVGAGDTPTKGYEDLTARVAWRPLAEAPGLELAIVGRNLTDSLQRNAVALNKDLVVLPGRDVRAVIRMAF